MIWNTIQGARVEKKAMRVTWLDLANAYDWLHQKALDFFYSQSLIMMRSK